MEIVKAVESTSEIDIKKLKVKKKIAKKKQHILIESSLRHVFLDDLYSTLFDGDLFVSIPGVRQKSAPSQSEFNKYKQISHTIVHKKFGVNYVESFLMQVAPPAENNDHFIRLLNSRSDQNCHELALLLDEYQTRVTHYKNRIKKEGKDMPLLNSQENYRLGVQQQLESFIQQFPQDSLIILRYYFDPFDKFMHLGSIGYNENFLKLMGLSRDQYVNLINQVGIVNHMHPDSQIAFMIQALQNQLGKNIDPQLSNVDLLTFDQFVVPFTMQAVPIACKPNEDGYFETFFVFKVKVQAQQLKILIRQRQESEMLKYTQLEDDD